MCHHGKHDSISVRVTISVILLLVAFGRRWYAGETALMQSATLVLSLFLYTVAVMMILKERSWVWKMVACSYLSLLLFAVPSILSPIPSHVTEEMWDDATISATAAGAMGFFMLIWLLAKRGADPSIVRTENRLVYQGARRHGQSHGCEATDKQRVEQEGQESSS